MRSKDLHRYFLILLLGSCPLSCLFAAKSYVRLSACAHELPSLCRSDVIHEGGLSAVHSRGNLAAKSTPAQSNAWLAQLILPAVQDTRSRSAQAPAATAAWCRRGRAPI